MPKTDATSEAAIKAEAPALPKAVCGAFPIKIRADGVWEHEGRPMKRLSLPKLFSTVLQIDEEGVYWLRTPVEAGVIEVEDLPFIATTLTVEAAGTDQQRCIFKTNLEHEICLDQAHPLRIVGDGSDEIRPEIEVRKGLKARISRAVYYQLMDFVQIIEAEQGTKIARLLSAGHWFDIAKWVEDEDVD